MIIDILEMFLKLYDIPYSVCHLRRMNIVPASVGCSRGTVSVTFLYALIFLDFAPYLLSHLLKRPGHVTRTLTGVSLNSVPGDIGGNVFTLRGYILKPNLLSW